MKIKKMLILLSTAIFLFVGCKADDYQAACEAFAARDYENAEKEFLEIDEEYKDVKQWKAFFEYIKTSEYDITDTTQINVQDALTEMEGGQAFSELAVDLTAQDICIGSFVDEHAAEMEILLENDTFSKVALPSLLRQADSFYAVGEISLSEMDAIWADTDAMSAYLMKDTISAVADVLVDGFESAKVRYELSGETEKASLCEEKIQEINDRYSKEAITQQAEEELGISLQEDEQGAGVDAPSYSADDELASDEYWCMGKGDTCKNKTYSPYDFYCSECDPNGDNIEG